MITSRISLDGDWEFRHSYFGSADESGSPRTISVPGPWQGQFADLRMRSGTAWYRREIDLPKGWAKGRIFLTFGAVFHLATVQVNGVPVCQNEGGFLPFSVDVT